MTSSGKESIPTLTFQEIVELFPKSITYKGITYMLRITPPDMGYYTSYKDFLVYFNYGLLFIIMEFKENYVQVEEKSNLFLYIWRFKSIEEHLIIWSSESPINKEFLEDKYKELTNIQCKTIEFSMVDDKYTGIEGLLYYV